MPEPDQSFASYRTWKGWDELSFGRVNQVQARYFEVEFRTAGVDLGRVGSMLEIGFGDASLAAWAKARGWRYAGTELDPDLVARARDAGLDAHLAETPLAEVAGDRRFDLIVAFDVLEHLTIAEIEGLLITVRDLFAPGGRFIARFPSGDSPFSGPIQHGDLTHKSVIGSGMVQQLALAADLEVLQIRAPVLPLTGLGLVRLLRRAPVKLARAIATQACRLVFFDGQARVVEPNMLVVLRPRQESVAQ